MTCGLNGGVVTYEEQFPDQLKTFYQGVSGYLYAVSPGPGVEAVANREATFFSRQAVPVTDMIFIPDVYDAILHYEQTGSIRIVRYHEMPQEKLQAIHDHITQWIAARDLPAQPETELARFYAAHFPVLWENASKSAKTP